MKVLNLIISDNSSDIYIKLKEQWRRYMNAHPDVTSYFLECDSTSQEVYKRDDTIYVPTEECLVPGIFIKTQKGILFGIQEYTGYDYIIRTNLSSFWIWNRVIQYLESKPRTNFVSSIPGEYYGLLFPSGCGMILSIDVATLIANHIGDINSLADDLIIGQVLSYNKIGITQAKRYDIPYGLISQNQNDSYFYLRDNYILKDVENIYTAISKIDSDIYHVRNNCMSVNYQYPFDYFREIYEVKNYKALVDTFYRSDTDIPIFVISYNNYTFVKSIVTQLLNYSKNIFIVDNASTYGPLVQYLKTNPDNVNIIHMEKNYGYRVLYEPRMSHILGQKYILTDPDLFLNPNMPQNFIDILDKLSVKYNVCRIGLALNMTRNDIRDDIKFGGKTIQEVQSEFWKKRIHDDDYELYEAFTDTTFSFINRNNDYKEYAGLRIAGDFTCIHKPFHIGWESELLDGELDAYKSNNNSTSCVKLDNEPDKVKNMNTIKLSWLRTR